MIQLKSLSQLPRHVEGSQPLTGACTGFNIDSYLGTVTMLAENFDSVLLAIYSFRILNITTCRLTAEIRGEIMQYGNTS